MSEVISTDRPIVVARVTSAARPTVDSAVHEPAVHEPAAQDPAAQDPAVLALRAAVAAADDSRVLTLLLEHGVDLLTAGHGDVVTSAMRELIEGPDAQTFVAYAVRAMARCGDELPTRGGPARTHRPPRPLSPITPLPLTGRETEVLRELALGGSYADIASALYVTENTVKTHMAAIYRKLGAERRGEALRRARDTGLL